ncbi:MAG: sulfotransferase family protein [Anaerolineae bacterium]|jgi:hypothetical protein
MEQDAIVVVSGLPRSGTSMMMKMLEAGGLPVLTDHIRTADEDNPKGYYEFERVKQIEEDRDWLPDAQGKAVKMIAALLKHLPADYAYKVIFMRRSIEEVLASQRQMLIRRGEPIDAVSDERMAELFRRHVVGVQAWLAEQPNVDTLYVDYGGILNAPSERAKRVNEFLDGGLDVTKMAGVVDPSLYRQRG